jgi:quercetin dioxygenase-like cupin family protein
MNTPTDFPGVQGGEGYAVGHLDDLGDGPGFRKVRKGLGVTAFGVNAIVMPPGIESGFHFHDEQEELYFVHRGTVEIEFGDGTVRELREGSFARVDAATPRKLRNRVPEGEEQRVRALHDLADQNQG